MSKTTKEGRPRIVSFPANLNGLDIAARRSVLLPCYVFSVSLPSDNKNPLNIFEQTVLKITEPESGNTKNIAEATCMDEDLVLFVQNRLSQLGLLNSRYELTDSGKESLGALQDISLDKTDYKAVRVFVSAIDNKLLPYVHEGGLRYENVAEMDGDSVAFRLDTRKNDIWAKLVPHPNNKCTPPSVLNILKAISEFRRRYRRYALLKGGEMPCSPPDIPSDVTLTVSEEPDLVHLHCIALVQKGNHDLVVTDGSEFGFSSSFANYLNNKESKWVAKLKQKAGVEKLGGNSEASSSSNEIKKYPKIETPLEDAKKYIAELESMKVTSSNSQKKMKNLINKVFISLYGAMEWALSFVVAEWPQYEWENLFSSQDYRGNEKLLRSLASKIGFKDLNTLGSLFKVRPAGITAFRKGEVDMQTLLALAIAGAVGNSNHGLHKLASHDPLCLSFILELKKGRDLASHGEDASIDADTLKEHFSKAIKIIKLLVPDLPDSIVEARSPKVGNENGNEQARLEARVFMDEYLGAGFTQGLPANIREEAIRAIMLCQNNLDGHLASRCIMHLSSAMELALYEMIRDRIGWSENKVSKKDEALEMIVSCGFYPSREDIPGEIKGVRDDMLLRVVVNCKGSIGAATLALFLFGSEEELKMLKEKNQGFIDLVAEVIRLRGHGNKPIDITYEDLDRLKRSVLESIKTTIEVFHG